MLPKKIDEAKEFIAGLITSSANPYVLFDGDNDSLVLLHLIKESGRGEISIPVLHVDTSLNFPEVYEFMEEMQRTWGFTLIRERNDEALETIDIANPRDKCCHELKDVPLARAVEKYRITHLILKGGASERSEQADGYMKCYPLLFFTEEDVRDYMKEYGLKPCRLYERGYKAIECYPCAAQPDKAATSAKDKADLERVLKALGYM